MLQFIRFCSLILNRTSLVDEQDLILRGRNYGWNIMGSLHCFPESVGDCEQSKVECLFSKYLYRGGDGCSTTDGYVYRGVSHEFLVGTDVNGDFCLGKIWALHFNGSIVTEVVTLVESCPVIPAIVEHRNGELYLLSFDGFIYHLKVT